MFKESKNPKIEELTKSHKERSIQLSSVHAIKIDNKRFCLWCAEVELKRKNQKYCSPECSRSAMAWAYPQKEENLALLLQKQNYKCNICQFDYAPILDEIVARFSKTTEKDWRNKYSWYIFKYLKSWAGRKRRPEVDHITPIYKGGECLGHGNHQVICYTCHKEKTSKDLSKKS